MKFQNPWFFILIILVIIALLFKYRYKTVPGIRFSSISILKGFKGSWKIFCARRVYLLKALGLIFIVLALAKPVEPLRQSKVDVEGIDIILAIDTSTSMLAEDFTIGGRRYNRLEVVKDVVSDFIEKRKNDRIGIVAFAARAYTVCPLTLDHQWLIKNLERVKIGIIEDGTAIGLGISSAINRLRDTKTKQKIIILLTDGMNNAGKISPDVAAEAARALNIKIYTIGAGSKGYVPYPVKDFFGRTVYQKVQINIDENTLKNIADITNGKYFRATDTKSLRHIYDEIDKLETTPIKEIGYLEYKQLFPIFLLIGSILLLLEIILSNTLLRQLP